MDGSTSISGGGLSYLLARQFGYTDLSWMGLLAAVGDMQNIRTGKMVGANRVILEDSIREVQLSAAVTLQSTVDTPGPS